MSDPVAPSVGLAVVHLFVKPTPLLDPDGLAKAVEAAEADDCQVVPVAILGHKADAAFMVLGTDWRRLRSFQTDIQSAGLDVVDSYVSLTEISEYASGMPDEMKQMRLYPQLPPEEKPAWCFYPMSRKRVGDQNWFAESFEEREAMMREHGGSGRKFAGRILQVITGSTGLDDWEWGVTLFAQKPDDLKDVVYTLRYDKASAVYAEFGPFYVGTVGDTGEILQVLAP